MTYLALNNYSFPLNDKFGSPLAKKVLMNIEQNPKKKKRHKKKKERKLVFTCFVLWEEKKTFFSV